MTSRTRSGRSARYPARCREDARQRGHDLREAFDAARRMVKTGTRWRYMPNHFPPRAAVYQPTRRRVAAGVFAAMVHDLRALLRLGEGRAPAPTAVVIGGRTLQSTPELGAPTSYDGHGQTLAGLHYRAFASLMLTRDVELLGRA